MINNPIYLLSMCLKNKGLSVATTPSLFHFYKMGEQGAIPFFKKYLPPAISHFNFSNIFAKKVHYKSPFFKMLLSSLSR